MTWGLHFYIFLFLSLVFFSSSRKICVVLLDEVWFQYDSRCFICKDSVIRSVLNTRRICLSLGRMMWWAPTGHSIRKRLRWCILRLLHGNRQLAQLENIILKSPASFALVNLKGGSSLPEPIFSFPFFFFILSFFFGWNSVSCLRVERICDVIVPLLFHCVGRLVEHTRTFTSNHRHGTKVAATLVSNKWPGITFD